VSREQTPSAPDNTLEAEPADKKLPWHPPTADLHGIDIVRNGITFNIVGDGHTTCQS